MTAAELPWSIPLTECDLDALPDRRRALLDPIDGGELIRLAVRDAIAGLDEFVCLTEASHTCEGAGRVIVRIPVLCETFDRLFNGVSGYRARYWQSVTEGEAFNRQVVDALAPLVLQAPGARSCRGFLSLARPSLAGSQAKIFVNGDLDAFTSQKTTGVLCPERWRDCAGARSPLPPPPQIDLKGGWIKDDEERFDVSKANRSERLHREGFT